MTFTIPQMRARAVRRLAEILYDHWEEGRVGHTRMFEVIVPDEWITHGRSVKGGHYREHVVPCAVIRDGCMDIYEKRKGERRTSEMVDEAASLIEKYLRIALITTEEAKYLDNELELKSTMPDGWVFGEGDPLARLEVAGIELVDQKK